jgi:disulfide oxidoreductase YuzD
MISKSHEFTLSGEVYSVPDIIDYLSDREAVKVKTVSLKPYMKYGTWFEEIPSIEEVYTHMERVQNADYSYPLILLRDKERMVDGNHRLCKALLEDVKYLEVKYISIKEFKHLNKIL